MSLITTNSTFKRIFDPRFDITKDFIADLDNRVNGSIPKHVVVSIYGETGSGKSTVMRYLSYFVLTKRDISKIHIRMERHQLVTDAQRVGERAIYGAESNVMVLDEQTEDFGVGTSRERASVTNLEEVCRKFKVSFFFVAPTIRVHSSAHYWLMTLHINEKDRITTCAVQDPRTGYCLGYIKLKIPDDDPGFNELELKYEAEKDKFIIRMLRGKTREGYLMPYAKKILDNPKLEECTNKKQMEIIVIQEFPNITRNETLMIIEYVNLIKKGVLKMEGYSPSNKKNDKKK